MKLGYSILVLIIIAAGIYFLAKEKKDISSAEYQTQTSMTTETNDTQAPAAGEQGPMMKVMKEGSGPESVTGDTVSVHYTGYLEDGTVFDSSVDRGTPFEFTLGEGRVIKGWEIGVLGMKVGEVRRLVIPAEYGYGAYGVPGVIPANATLAFEVEVLAITKPE